MARDNPNTHRHGENLDADAVCAACGTVNPEGSFICRVCGNNLRDQRQRRMNADQLLDGTEATGLEKRQIVSAVLGILGILLVLWVGLNVGNIEARLLDSQLGGGSAVATLWDGPESIVFNRMIDNLIATSLTDEQIAEAEANPVIGTTPDGIYVLVWPEGTLGGGTAGIAAVETQGGSIYFAAQMKSGVEIRGRAEQTGSAYTVSDDRAAILANGAYTGVNGVAAPQVDGSFEILGFGAASDTQYSVIAFRLP